MRRHHITLGALTTANGVVVSASSHGTINDQPIALEGDKIMCRSCKSTGYIICVGPRIPETWMGKQVALEGDLCVCKCKNTPKLIPTQSLRFQLIEGAASLMPAASSANAGAAAAASSAANGFEYDEQVRIKDEDGNPIANVPYHITDESGNVFQGFTDEQGCCERVYTDGAHTLNILLGVPALEKW